MRDTFTREQSTAFLASKHHLLPGTRSTDALQITRDIVALHATSATTPYISLWARMAEFQREMLEEALYQEKSLSRILCMRSTVHIVPSDHAASYIRGFGHLSEKRTPPRFRNGGILVQAGVCSDVEANSTYATLVNRIVRTLIDKGPLTAKELSESMPELRVRMPHDVGKNYEGEFSIGSRIINSLAAQGVIIRTRPRGTWRSSLYEYAALGDWLPRAQLERVTEEQAQRNIVAKYFAAFGPTSMQDAQWWTGLTKSETASAVSSIQFRLDQVEVQGTGQELWMLEEDRSALQEFTPPAGPAVFMLPSLDPFIMGYGDRRRFLSNDHDDKVFDRAGNALPTVWAGGRIVGVWGQRRDGKIITGFFEHVDDDHLAAVAGETERLQGFVGDEFIKPAFFHTHFSRALEAQ